MSLLLNATLHIHSYMHSQHTTSRDCTTPFQYIGKYLLLGVILLQLALFHVYHPVLLIITYSTAQSLPNPTIDNTLSVGRFTQFLTHIIIIHPLTNLLTLFIPTHIIHILLFLTYTHWDLSYYHALTVQAPIIHCYLNLLGIFLVKLYYLHTFLHIIYTYSHVLHSSRQTIYTTIPHGTIYRYIYWSSLTSNTPLNHPFPLTSG